MRKIAIAVLCVAASSCGVLYTPEAAMEKTDDLAALSRIADYEPLEEEPMGVEESHHSGVYDAFFGAAVASIEERIYLSDIVVRATLASSASGLLTFNAMEYLKGEGPNQFAVSAHTANRNTRWDDDEAMLFLSKPDTSQGAAAGDSNSTFEFTDTTTFQDHRS